MTNWEPDQPYGDARLFYHHEDINKYFFEETRVAARHGAIVPFFSYHPNHPTVECHESYHPTNQKNAPLTEFQFSLTDRDDLYWRWDYRLEEYKGFQLTQILTCKRNHQPSILYKNDGRGDFTANQTYFSPSSALVNYTANAIRTSDAFASLYIPSLNKAIESDKPKLVRKSKLRRRIENATHYLLDTALCFGISSAFLIGIGGMGTLESRKYNQSVSSHVGEFYSRCYRNIFVTLDKQNQHHPNYFGLGLLGICALGVGVRRLTQELEHPACRSRKWITEFHLDFNDVSRREHGEPIPTYKKSKRFAFGTLTKVDFTYVSESKLPTYPAAYRAFSKQR
jgi:hypothetical protein